VQDLLDIEVKMENLICDFLVIGSGPAGQKAAIQAAKLGKNVIVIEKDKEAGGASVNSGTIPSKSLREAILDLTGFHDRSFYGRHTTSKEVSIADLTFRLYKVLAEERSLVLRQFRKNNVRLVFGRASFNDRNQMSIYDTSNNEIYRIRSEKILIATGSSPRDPKNIPFDGKVIIDSTALIDLERVPKSMVVVGSGIIGSEYASFFSALGTKVTVIDKNERMLGLLDAEIGAHLQKALMDIGLEFKGGRVLDKIERKDDQGYVFCKNGEIFESETVLYALGRSANVHFLNIDKVGLELTSSGHIPVNALFQTIIPNIYAAGDVIGPPALASTSMEQGRLAARQAFGAKATYFPSVYPIGIYTIPEISSLGYTEEELISLNFNYEVGRAYYYEIARGHISGSLHGIFKILFHKDTLEILGIHILGRSATELIHIGQVAMSFNAKIDYFIHHIFNYPTFAEGYRIAAFNGLNKIKRIK
jgi:NAD(P) transhydrogenase